MFPLETCAPCVQQGDEATVKLWKIHANQCTILISVHSCGAVNHWYCERKYLQSPL